MANGKNRRGKGMAGVSRQKLLRIYETMVMIRTVEDALAEDLVKGLIGCPVHLYSGEEAVATGVCSNLNAKDWVYSSHRSHGHYLAKGGDLYKLMAEVYCRSGGCSKGRGGSMHLSQPEIGFPGSSAIVAGSIALAVGSALAFTMDDEQRVAATFFGDGAVGEGVFYESLNFAALNRLPVVFVCENNLYSTHMPIAKCTANLDLLKKARAMGVPSRRVDGNDVVEVQRTAARMVRRARLGEGPSFLECMTYRHRGHVGPNYDIEKGLRCQEEFDCWLEKDPIGNLELRLLEASVVSQDQLNDIKDRLKTEVAVAQDRGRGCEWPEWSQDDGFKEVFRRRE